MHAVRCVFCEGTCVTEACNDKLMQKYGFHCRFMTCSIITCDHTFVIVHFFSAIMMIVVSTVCVYVCGLFVYNV